MARSAISLNPKLHSDYIVIVINRYIFRVWQNIQSQLLNNSYENLFIVWKFKQHHIRQGLSSSTGFISYFLDIADFQISSSTKTEALRQHV